MKNRHKISLVAAICVILAASVVMVQLYPFFYSESVYADTSIFQYPDFLQKLIHTNYVLDYEFHQRESDEEITPYEYYFNVETDQKEDSTDNVRNLINLCSREYSKWSHDYERMKDCMDIMVQSDSKTFIETDSQNMEPDYNYMFKIVMDYDSRGELTIPVIYGGEVKKITGFIEGASAVDPVMSYYNQEYSALAAVSMEKPKNITFTYAITKDQMIQLADMSQGMLSPHNYLIVTKVFTGMLAAVAVCAFLLSCIDPRLGEQVKILRTSLEVVLVIVVGGIGFGYSLTNLVAVTNQGNLYESLCRAGFAAETAEDMVKLWNLLWWSLPFSVTYWGILCLRDSLGLGIWACLTQRTLIGRLFRFLRRLCGKFLEYISDISSERKSNGTLFKIFMVNILLLLVPCYLYSRGGLFLFIYGVVQFFILRKFYTDLSIKFNSLLKAAGEIAEGNLDVVMEQEMGLFEPFRSKLQKIQSGFKLVVEEEIKSQKLKTDLISNMSHDLKTPLTAIITYVDLLKNDSADLEQRKLYIEVLEKKSLRLKALIEDLFEISKAYSNDVVLNLETVDIVTLLKEVALEISDKIEESTVEFRWNLPEEKILIPLDSQKTYRIFDNLLSNIIKYAMPYTRAYIDMKKENGMLVVSMKNISSTEMDFSSLEITERFVRGDQSRNTEGSGLGLAIAKSFVELQNGKLLVEVEADLFRVTIFWPCP